VLPFTHEDKTLTGRGFYPLSLWERVGVRGFCPLSLWERVGVRGFCSLSLWERVGVRVALLPLP
jgi:hypothetical protein